MSAKAVVGRALRETGAALKQASGAEVCLRGVLTMAVARRSGISCMAICRRNGGVWPPTQKVCGAYVPIRFIRFSLLCARSGRPPFLPIAFEIIQLYCA